MEVLEPKFNDPLALPYGGESGVVESQRGLLKHSDILSFMREKRAARACHSDGFLSLGGMTESAYECESCGFNGLIEADVCIRCGSPVTSIKGRR